MYVVSRPEQNSSRLVWSRCWYGYLLQISVQTRFIHPFVIGEINDANQCLIPIAIGPVGEIGSTFRRFWDGSDPLPLPPFEEAQSQARQAAIQARSLQIPWNTLGNADERWKTEHDGALFGGSYLCALRV